MHAKPRSADDLSFRPSSDHFLLLWMRIYFCVSRASYSSQLISIFQIVNFAWPWANRKTQLLWPIAFWVFGRRLLPHRIDFIACDMTGKRAQLQKDACIEWLHPCQNACVWLCASKSFVVASWALCVISNFEARLLRINLHVWNKSIHYGSINQAQSILQTNFCFLIV